MIDVTFGEGPAVHMHSDTDIVSVSSRLTPSPITAPDMYYNYDWPTAGHGEGRCDATLLSGKGKGKARVVCELTHLVVHTRAVDRVSSTTDSDGSNSAAIAGPSQGDHTSNTATVDTNSPHTAPHPGAATTSFRHADGGGNGPRGLDMGRAGTPYARRVQGRDGLPRHSLPDPGLVFDAILKKSDHQDHPGGMSSMAVAFASLIAHSLFRTDPQNVNINNASSYLDLSPLYGDDQEAQNRVRDRAAGLGLLYPDTFSEDRLLFSPATSALLVIFSRNHNYIAQKLSKINEHKKWSRPPPTDPTLRSLQDEEIFQTARLINCGHFKSAVMGDFVGGFLGLSEGPVGGTNAFDTADRKNIEVPRGGGNHVSVESNILYRWGSAMSEQDQKWTGDVSRHTFGGEPSSDPSTSNIKTTRSVIADVPPEPSRRVFAGLHRGGDGSFSDDDLADILQCATDNPAGAFRGRGTPEALRDAEILGIEQSRDWGTCTMNEFRQFLGLKKIETFEEWNPDPDIAGAARRLYGHVDNLELYTGLQAEAMMPLTDGLRLACGYTTTRAVLGDIIALIRGDKFYTNDFTPANLTTWGYHDSQRDMDNGGFGGHLSKLLIRNLPRHYPYNSIYSLFPFFTPPKVVAILKKRNITARYHLDRPKPLPIAKIFNTFTGIKYAFSDPSRFKVMYGKHRYGSFLMFDDTAPHVKDKAMIFHALFPDKESLSKHADWYRTTTQSQLLDKSWRYPSIPGTYVDITHTIKALSAQFAADKLCGVPLKTKGNPSGVYTEQEMFDMLSSLYAATFFTLDNPENAFALHTSAFKANTIIEGMTTKSLLEVSPIVAPTFLSGLAARARTWLWPTRDKPFHPFLSNLAESGLSFDSMIGNIVGIAVGASVNLAQATILVINFYIDDDREKERRHIIQLCRQDDGPSMELLRGYVREAMRLRPPFSGLFRQAIIDAKIPQGGGLPPLEVKTGDRIWGNFRKAHLNPIEFPDPQVVDPRRPPALYNLNGIGFHRCSGTFFSQQIIAEIVKVVFKLKNVRRAPGDAGQLIGFSELIRESELQYYLTETGKISAFPGPLHLVYDE